jgi:hypothetical protein
MVSGLINGLRPSADYCFSNGRGCVPGRVYFLFILGGYHVGILSRGRFSFSDSCLQKSVSHRERESSYSLVLRVRVEFQRKCSGKKAPS